MYSDDKRIQICVEMDLLATRCHCSQKLHVLLQAQKMGRGTKRKKALQTQREVVTTLSRAAFLQSVCHIWDK